jgi:hypothetical protein
MAMIMYNLDITIPRAENRKGVVLDTRCLHTVFALRDE